MTELVRTAVRRLRAESEEDSFERLLAATAGLWAGLAVLDELRAEWDER